MPMPKTVKGKAKLLFQFLTTGQSAKLASRQVRARDFEEHARKHYERKYGKKNVAAQKHSKHSGRRADIAVNY